MFSINSHHRLEGVEYCASPFFNERPIEEDISLLVIHHISLPAGIFGGSYVKDLFLGRLETQVDPRFKPLQGLEVSAHCFIRRDGSVIQFVPFNKRAWHAGKSCFQGRENCNDFSIGIELEGTGAIAYTKRQYQILADLTQAIRAHYPQIILSRITGHENIAPGRKTDPGPSFDWEDYLTRLS